MEVFIVRHAIAHERNAKLWRDDSLRPLTDEGIRKFRKAARGLKRIALRPQRMLTSPYARARQTAELLTAVTRWPKARECAALAQGGSPDDVIRELRKFSGKRLALVGHEPDLGRLIGVCIAKGDAAVGIDIKKGGAACLEFTGTPRPGGARLRWLATPRTLRALR